MPQYVIEDRVSVSECAMSYEFLSNYHQFSCMVSTYLHLINAQNYFKLSTFCKLVTDRKELLKKKYLQCIVSLYWPYGLAKEL